ncbi:MAG: hypothetical protein ACKO45_10295, partial [Cyanobium sp.]
GLCEGDQPQDWPPSLPLWWRSLLVNDLALFAGRLGRLAQAQALRQLDNSWKTTLAEPYRMAIGLINSSEVALDMGRLAEAHGFADQAWREAEAAQNDLARIIALGFRACAAHARGEVAAAEADFAAATQLEGGPLVSLEGAQHTRHHLDLGNLPAARALVDHNLARAQKYNWNFEIPGIQALLARLALAEGRDPTAQLEAIRAWSTRTGEMKWIITAHLLAAQHSLATGDNQAALAEAELGLLHAESCGYGLLRIELLIALARLRLAWPDPPAAIQAARQALDLSAAPECGYAWGEADAAQAWGEAYVANGEPALAQRAFSRALAVRQRIRHPGTTKTERWLARLPIDVG